MRNSEPKAEGELQITRELRNLEKQISALAESASRLIGRLTVVSRNEPACEPDKNPDEVVCEMADTIRGYSGQVLATRERLEHQFAILEL